jgi:hypothetical protein
MRPTTARLPVLVALTLCIASLAACGGGGGSDDGSSVSRLQTFDDGSGTAVGTVQIDGEDFVLVGFSSDASEFDDIVGGSPSETPPIDANDLVYVSSNAYGDFYRFSVLYEGVTYEGVAYQEAADESLLIFGGDGAGYTFALAQANSLTNLPTSGVATYAGTNLIGSRDGLFSESGTFSMLADFGKGTVALNGTTPNSSITASGLPIDGRDGTFEGLQGTLTVNGVSEPASIVGAFSGDDAFGVSGIYLDNDRDESGPEYVGAFDG